MTESISQPITEISGHMNSSTKEEIEDSTECPICMDTKLSSTTASVFNCGHAFCNSCVSRLGCSKPCDPPQLSNVPCPICYKPLGYTLLFLDKSIVDGFVSSVHNEEAFCLICHNMLNKQCLVCEADGLTITSWNPCNSVIHKQCGGSLHRHCLHRWFLHRKQCPFPNCELPIPALFN